MNDCLASNELRQLWRSASGSDKGNFFEYVIEGLIEQFCFNGAIAIHAGANYGAHCFSMLAAVGPNGKVTAFEPHPELAARLRSWERPNLVVVESALADQPGSTEFLLTNEVGYGSIHERPKFDLTISGRIQVAVTTLDSEMHGAVDFIKADIEGAEIAMLHGGVETLRRATPLVVMELDWGFAFNGDPSKAGEFFALLDKLEYDVVDCFGDPVRSNDCDAWNVILVPRKRAISQAVRSICIARAHEFLHSKLGWNPYQKFDAA